MVVGSFGLILGLLLGLRLRLRLGLEWWLQPVVSGICRLLGLTPAHVDVERPLSPVPRRCGGFRASAAASLCVV
jgi:hypothetical protein